MDTRPAALQDDLRLTINYAQVYKAVKQIVEEERFDLIETLAGTTPCISAVSLRQRVCACVSVNRTRLLKAFWTMWLSTSSARKSYGSRLPRLRF